MKISLSTLLTIISFAVIATVSHTKLVGHVDTQHAKVVGKFDTLEATNKLDHDYLKQELKELKMVDVDGIPIYLADDNPIVKKKKSYAGSGGTFEYAEE